MNRTRDLIRRVDPLRDRPDAEPSARAREELAALIGSANPGVVPAGRLRRPRRRWVLVTATAAVVAVIGIAAALSAGDDRVLEPAPAPLADQPYYGNTATLEAKADLIVRATLVSTRERASETVATIAVAKVAKDARGDVVAGSRVNCSYRTLGSGPDSPKELSVGREYVFLLVRFDDGTVSLVSTIQGYYHIVDGRAVPAAENPVTLSPQTTRALDLR